MPDLWIVEHYLNSSPRLVVRPLLRETNRTYTTQMRSGVRTYVKGAAGRRYFTSEAAAVAHLRELYTTERKRALRTAARMAIMLTATDAELLLFAQGDEATCDAIESAVSKLLAEHGDRHGSQ